MPLFTDAAEKIDRRFGWDKLPWPLGLVTLIGLRNRLRQENLYDTGQGPLNRPDISVHPRYMTARTLDGTFNDLDDPLMGSLGSRFGRNVPLEATVREPEDQLLEPNPRLVSRELLTRNDFKPATTLNLLAAVWIQFEVHDWFSHGKNEARTRGSSRSRMTIPGPRARCGSSARGSDPSGDAGLPPTFATDDTHWWDGSQIYGRDPAFAEAIRPGEQGKLRLDEGGLIPQDIEAHIDLSGVAGNFWVGLALLHSLFMREHNAICDRLHAGASRARGRRALRQGAARHRGADGEDPHGRLDAGDHRPPHDPVRGLRANWWGLLGERLARRFGRCTSNEVMRGIPGSPTNHHGVPYSLTEEFVAVYRMHPLIPDDFSFRSLGIDAVLQERTLQELGVLHVRELLNEMRWPTCSIRSAPRTPARSRCTTTRASSRTRSRRRDAYRPRRHRHPARPRARRAALQRLPAAVPHEPFDTFEEMADTPEHAEICVGSTATSSGST